MAIEWETGNTSSSHRALNIMCVGFLEGDLNAGALILPSRDLYKWLTDRVGNFKELRPYFPVWEAISNQIEANLVIFEVEYDDISRD